MLKDFEFNQWLEEKTAPKPKSKTKIRRLSKASRLDSSSRRVHSQDQESVDQIIAEILEDVEQFPETSTRTEEGSVGTHGNIPTARNSNELPSTSTPMSTSTSPTLRVESTHNESVQFEPLDSFDLEHEGVDEREHDDDPDSDKSEQRELILRERLLTSA